MKRNIGFLNNNWKGGHRRDEYETVPLPARRVLEIKIDTLKSLLIPGVTPETMHPELEQKIADAEQQLRELDADPFADPQPPTEAELQEREAASYDWLTKDVYMEQTTNTELDRLLAPEIVRGDLASSHKVFSGSDWCAEAQTDHAEWLDEMQTRESERPQ